MKIAPKTIVVAPNAANDAVKFASSYMAVPNSMMCITPFLKGDDAKSFINRLEFKDFVDGIGAWKWSTDQTLLNFFLKKYKVPTKNLNGKWNGLYSAVDNIKECHFVHFFLKDLLPNGGENVEELMKTIWVKNPTM